MKTGLRLWDDACRGFHQIIADDNKMVLYEREKYTSSLDVHGVSIKMKMWHPWKKVKEPYKMSKAWFIKELTVEDIILCKFEQGE